MKAEICSGDPAARGYVFIGDIPARASSSISNARFNLRNLGFIPSEFMVAYRMDTGFNGTLSPPVKLALTDETHGTSVADDNWVLMATSDDSSSQMDPVPDTCFHMYLRGLICEPSFQYAIYSAPTILQDSLSDPSSTSEVVWMLDVDTTYAVYPVSDVSPDGIGCLYLYARF